MFKRFKFQRQDPILSLLLATAILIGTISVFSTTYSFTNGVSPDFWDHLLFTAVGIIIYFALSQVPAESLLGKRTLLFLGIFTIIVLVLLMIKGEVVYGARRWFSFGAFSVQPSEFAKLTVILLTASGLYNIWREKTSSNRFAYIKIFIVNNWQRIFYLGMILSILLLIWVQPSLGNVLITLSICIFIIASAWKNWRLLWAGGAVFFLGLNWQLKILALPGSDSTIELLLISIAIIFLIYWRWRVGLLGLLAVFVCGVGFAVSTNWAWTNLLTDYQRGRIVTYFHPESDPLGAYWQVGQAKIAIASGQLLGKGILQGTQTSFGFLPLAETDFAYAAFVEQFGLVGAIVILSVLCSIIIRIIQIAENAPNSLYRYVCIGVAGLLLANSLINIGMNLGVMPVTGVPLPFISYGGSATIVNFIALALIQMVHTQTPPQVVITKLAYPN